MQKAICIYNPISGYRSTPRKLDYILGRFQEHNILIQPYRFQGTEHEKLIKVLKQEDYAYIVISGGDGTLNSMINLLLKNGINLPIGIIPSGTCNDLAGSLGLPMELNECIDIILSGKTAEIDVGLINEDKYFLSTCAGGIFVDASFRTHSELKKNFGPFAYYLKALTELKSIKPFKLKIKTDTDNIEEKVLLFVILNGKHAAGFSKFSNDADVSDGMMDIVMIKNCLHIDLAGLFLKVLSNSSLKDRNVTTLKTSSCVIECSKEITLSVDGEKGPNLPINVRFINKALKVFVK